MTLDAVIQPGSQSGLGETTYVPLSGGAVVANTSSAVGANTVLTVTEGVTLLATCTISVGGTGCSTGLPVLSAGAHSVTYTFDDGVGTVSFGGTIFAVTTTPPTIAIEWQDADGTWIDGTDSAVPLLASASTAGRCLVTNNSNAPATFNGFSTTVNHPVGPPTIVALTDTLAAGETRSFAMYSGLAEAVSNYGCSGGVTFPPNLGSGAGAGGTVVPVEGTLAASLLTVDPGDTVSITGSGLIPALSSSYAITVNGVAASGSPTTLVMPGSDLSFDVVFPTSGTYTLAVHNVFGGQDITFASFTVNVTGLAATGADVAVPLVLGSVLLLAGVAFMIVRARVARRAKP